MCRKSLDFFDADVSACVGTLQLFSDGTWELILDLCGEYWTGKSLSLMTESVRPYLLLLVIFLVGYSYPT